ncbi:MAG: GNAT family N-acetyltransferase [Thermoplasmata archaeon]|nr:GNAT family N-acetyltransferase [Thermoplasmata archaeon]
MDIGFRDTVPEDFGDLSRIIDDEWEFGLYSEENGRRMAEFYLLSCIDGSDRAVTLLADGKAKGVLILKEMGGPAIDMSEELSLLQGELSSDPGFRQLLEDMDSLYGCYTGFANDAKRDEWAELRLLIVADECKGHGFGRMMMDEAERIAESSRKTGFFFYTDTDCNFGFYDHIGSSRVAEREIMCMGTPLTVYGYSLVFR